MDSTLLSKMLKELLSRYDRVVLPRFGEFYVENVPASFSDRGFTINPPYRKVCFRTDESVANDGVLAAVYAGANDADVKVAGQVLEEYIIALKRRVFSERSVTLPGFGRLRAAREGVAFFVEDENLELFPGYDELSPISLRNLEAAGNAASMSVTESAAKPLPEPLAVSEPESESETADEPEPGVETESESGPESVETDGSVQLSKMLKKKKRRRRAIVFTLSVIILAESALLAFAVLGRMRPDLVDPLLYDRYQLEIIHTNLNEI